jgi:hypothetical protein
LVPEGEDCPFCQVVAGLARKGAIGDEDRAIIELHMRVEHGWDAERDLAKDERVRPGVQRTT